MLLMIDNYDSFTFNLVQYFQQLGQEVVVRRHDEIDLDGIAALQPDHLVISPGPKSPDEAGISLAAVARFAGRVPILGVCLGHQTLAQHFGADVVRAERVMHGKTSAIEHRNQGVFHGLPQPLTVTRYHSLVVDPDSVPDCLEVTAWCQAPSGAIEIMGLRHRELPVQGVQFHPESILTEQGLQLLDNFLSGC
ncbi:aminodeoxychorismate/anthranilate synthase component II [Ferrimonas balearica]|uniref:anthranilate synthase component II n=1 Tax=Ferrimonas balearica TaxID=44012 RepID=UPI001C57C015|nr:aminodeoxychorismate/anthranilate synthase component II [Ferrimonas balearica]MBW3141031.1 aminodeoxychorismate/anthranilate synthase component II [Ferrimonas balearica]MBY6107945.1 aminodeoxychorismate/anthranilate synthase component II [Ferrimonas balearica]